MENRVVFYGANDGASGLMSRRAEPILNQFDSSKVYDDINDVLELYSIKQFFDAGIYLPTWSDEEIERYKAVIRSFAKPIHCFLVGINDSNLAETLISLDFRYKDTFWDSFSYYKVFKRVSGMQIINCIASKDAGLRRILKHKELVYHYGNELAAYMRNAAETGNILVRKFLQADSPAYYIPKELKPSEFDEILQNAVNSDDISIQNLSLIYSSRSTGEFPISDKLRLSAKRSYKEKEAISTDTGIFYFKDITVCIGENENNELVIEKIQGEKEPVLFISYDKKTLENCLDYSSVFKIIINAFDLFDLFGRYKYISSKDRLTKLEGLVHVVGAQHYAKGAKFDFYNLLSLLKIQFYYKFLLGHNIRLEKIFEWFFCEYLPEEFAASGFMFNIPSENTMPYEKCRTIADEMDGVLKQFRMFVRDGKVDEDLFSMSSEHMKVDAIPSMLSNKYAYSSKSTDLEKEQFLLFSDQSLLTFTSKTNREYDNFFSMLQHESLSFNDFSVSKHQSLTFLEQQGSIIIKEDGTISLNRDRILILKDLYENEVICLNYIKKARGTIDTMISHGELVVENQLFSRPEQDYLNFFLNQARFSNGYDLRNKYAHSTYRRDTETQWNDYFMLLRIMIIVIVKINEEFVLREEISINDSNTIQ